MNRVARWGFGLLLISFFALPLPIRPAWSSEEWPSPTARLDLDRAATWSVANAPADYAGSWFGRSDQRIHIGFTAHASDYSDILQGLVSNPGLLAVDEMARSWRDLLLLQETVNSDILSWKADGIEITGTGIVPEANSISIRVRVLTDHARSDLIARYGSEGVALEQGDYIHLAHRSQANPWKGGMHIRGECGGTTDCTLADCTANFQTFEYIKGLKFYHMLTAGHCFKSNSLVTNEAFKPIGQVVQRFWSNGVRSDVEKFTNQKGHSAYVYTKGDRYFPVTSHEVNQSTGDNVCKSGITTLETCNWDVTKVHALEVICENASCSSTIELVDQLEAVRASYGIDYGDSGGPVYTYDAGTLRAHGIVSAKDDSGQLMTYTFLNNALSDVSANLCIRYQC